MCRMSKSTNELIKLLTEFPDEEWHWNSLSSNPNMTIEYVISNLEKPWNWYRLSYTLKVTTKYVLENSHLPWNYSALSRNSSFSISDVETSPCIDWDWDVLSSVLILSIDDINRHFDKWNWTELARNSCIVHEYIEAFPNLLVSPTTLRTNVSRSPSINIADISSSTIHWDWRELSMSQYIPTDYIRKNPELPWDYYLISYNPNLRFKDIEDILDSYYISWFGVSSSLNINIANIRNNLTRPWDWNVLSENPIVRMEDIDTNPDLPWNWEYIAKNPNLTAEYIKSNLDIGWDWSSISKNKFNQSESLKIVKQKTIVRYWRKFLLYNRCRFINETYRTMVSKGLPHDIAVLISIHI